MEFKLSDDKTRLIAADNDTPAVKYDEAGSFGKKLDRLRFLIMHYTAGKDFDSTVARFKDPAAKVSAHFVLGRQGQLAQMVPLDRPAWHAGSDSSWKGPDGTRYEHMNFYSLGIEIDNYGPLTKVGSRYRTWFGRDVDAQEVVEVDPTLPRSFNVRYWHAFSPNQISLAMDVARALVRDFDLDDIIGHYDVCPGRKQDPGPAFPIDRIRASLAPRDDIEDEQAPGESTVGLPVGVPR